ncbi:recombinase family protein [Brucella sp.]|uniref:recombinase family protein n=1 Tax=Brucella sp. TaxID=52132 RepID=UPI00391D6AFD
MDAAHSNNVATYRGQLVGYARTSTTDQRAGLAAQERDLTAAGCDRIFSEQTSAKDAKRTELQRALEHLREGDTFIVTKLDRLARSVADLVDITSKLHSKGVGLRILAMNLDTGTPTGKLMVNLLGSIAEFERELMLERQREGIAAAKAEGKYKGRAPTAQREADTIICMKDEGKSVAEIISATGVGRSSVFSILKEAGRTTTRPI